MYTQKELAKKKINCGARVRAAAPEVFASPLTVSTKIQIILHIVGVKCPYHLMVSPSLDLHS